MNDLLNHLKNRSFYGEQTPILSPTPYILTKEQVEYLEKLGPMLARFATAIDALYKTSLKEEEYGWVKQLFFAGKPASLLNFSQMNRFKNNLPHVIRPDLLVTEKGFTLTEIDSVPGGIGFTAALSYAYRMCGHNIVEIAGGMASAFVTMLKSLTPENPNPKIAVIISDEAGDYRKEMTDLLERARAFTEHIYLVHPKSIQLRHDTLGFVTETGDFETIDTIYRFFELFDLPNIPQMELIQYAVKKGIVTCTPPFKPHLEEKFALALIHHPFLTSFWEAQLSKEEVQFLKELIPESWVLDPAAIPFGAELTPKLEMNGKRFRTFNDLFKASQKQRELVIKPSGFSPLAWGSRGVHIGHDLSEVDWNAALTSALSQYATTPHLLQRFSPAKVEPYQYFHQDTGEIQSAEGRTRLCPYYFIQGQTPKLVGVLATTCPKNKKIIHGMSTGVMRPAGLLVN